MQHSVNTDMQEHLTLIPFVSHVAMLEPRNVQTNIITYNATLKDIGANWLTALAQIRLGTKLGPGCLVFFGPKTGL